MSETEEQLTFEELEFGVKLWSGVALGIALINVALLIFMIVTVFRGFAWYKALLIYVVLTFILKVLKRYCRNIADSCQEDIDAQTARFE